ncbi:GntR family transcriptional regulator [Pectinatus haikarae]|uniref:GntR family transcriptional regulator n=1 Tax=Pectinatus haikarae TaxID=349096 RepID=A0ABT9Y9Y8_9FIRM|nr:GntR family transcriptional regulator [Pectinatus haikarae]MDQ0204632.1 GntR family transcriptional regulator [Pectinatus haikarae]
MIIDRDNGVPYYIQLMELLRKQIAAGILQEGQRILSEVEMGKVYRINRHTVRQAIDELCRLGELYKIRGRGTFIAKALLDTVEYQLSAKNRFTENIKKIGATPSTKILQTNEIIAPEKVRKALDLDHDERVYFHYVQRSINERPFLIGQAFLPVKYFLNALPYLNVLESMSEFYAKYNINYERAKSTIQAVFPTKEEALLLDIPRNMPVLKVKKLMKSQTGIMIAYGISCYRSDVAELSISW